MARMTLEECAAWLDGSEVHESMRESAIEKDCREYVERIGGHLLKWVSPGKRGVQDRLLILPGGRVIFVEFKAPGGKLSAPQRRWRKKLENVGCECWVVDDADVFVGMVDTLLDAG